MTTSSPSAPQSYTGIVGPGQTLPVAVVGTQFYFPVASGQLWARQSGGLWASFVQGTGQDCGQQFTQVEINNPGSSPLVFQIVASTDEFIDHRLISNQSTQNVIRGIQTGQWTGPSGPNNLFTATAKDLSGTQFTDSQGRTWIAIMRVSINVNSAVAGGVVGSYWGSIGNNPAPYSLSASGDFPLTYEPPSPSIALGAQVFEIYQAVAPGFAANPPN